MSKKLLTGVILGAAVGAAMGILFAPDKGKETRKKLAKQGGNMGDAVKNKFNELGEALQEKYDSIRGEANSLVEKGKDAGQNFKDKAKDYKDEAKKSFA